MPDFPWPSGSATGIGSLPGTDVTEAQRVVFGELPDLPHLAELPARGPGADMIGRTAGLLVEIPVQLYAGRWQIASRPGKDLRVTADLLERDLDQLTEQGDGFTGTLKIQATGPWTLAAGLDLPIGGRMLRDPGAVRDLADSLTEGLRRHVAEVRKRVPGATVLLQLDEPSLPTVLAGRVRTESGLAAYREVDGPDAATVLRSLISRVGAPVVVHCCAPAVPLQVIRDAQATAVAFDLSLVKDLDPIGEAIEAGLGIFLGAVPSTGTARPDAKQIADRAKTFWQRLGFPAARFPEQVVITPACGLAGATPGYARDVLKAVTEASRRISEV
jgi:methionine synthase II (cobalamin-independent)